MSRTRCCRSIRAAPSPMQYSPIPACQAMLPCSCLQKSPTAGQICNANVKQKLKHPFPQCYHGTPYTCLLFKSYPSSKNLLHHIWLLVQAINIPVSSVRRARSCHLTPQASRAGCFPCACRRCKAAAAAVEVLQRFHFPRPPLSPPLSPQCPILLALAQGRHPPLRAISLLSARDSLGL